jgi:signal transduction histidine kinase
LNWIPHFLGISSNAGLNNFVRMMRLVIKICLTLLFLLFTPLKVSSQILKGKEIKVMSNVELLDFTQEILDSYLLNNNHQDSVFLKAYYYHVRALKRENKYDEVVAEFSEVNLLGNSSIEKQFIGNSYVVLGIAHKKLHNYNLSRDAYFKAKLLFEEIKSCPGQVKVHNNLGNLYNSQSYYSLAIEQFQECLSLLENCSNDYQKAVITKNLAGLVFNYQKDTMATLSYFGKAEDILEDSDHKLANYHLFNIYKEEFRINLDQGFVNKEVWRKILNVKKDVQQFPDVLLDFQELQLLYDFYSSDEKSPSAITNFRSGQQSLPFRFEMDHAQMYLKSNRVKQAISILESVLKREKLGFDKELQVREVLEEQYVFNSNNNHKINNLKRISFLKSKLFEIENIKKWETQRYKIENIKKEQNQKLELLRKDDLLKQLELKSNNLRLRNFGYVLIGVLLISLLVIIALRLRGQKEKVTLEKVKLQAEKESLSLLLEQKEREEEYRNYEESLKSKKQEQKRISQNLHDNIGANLAAIKLSLEDDKDAYLQKLINDVYVQVKDLSYELGDLAKNNNLFVDLLNNYLENIELSTHIEVNFEHDEEVDIENVPYSVKKELFGIIRELIQNVIKHAQATSINISFQEKNNNLILIFEDDGIGFDVLKTNKGFGLNSITERVERLQGLFEIESEIGKGTVSKILLVSNE